MLRYTRSALKDLRRLDPTARTRIVQALERLIAEDPSLDVRRVTGSAHLRIRVGGWRVIFDDDRQARTVIVRRVLPRGRAYDR